MNTLSVAERSFAKNDDLFVKQVEEAFKIYDADNKGYLTKDKVRIFVDDLRISMGLDKCSDRIFREIWKIIDMDGNGELEIDEFIEQRHSILPILSEPGDKMCSMITNCQKNFMKYCLFFLVQ